MIAAASPDGEKHQVGGTIRESPSKSKTGLHLGVALDAGTGIAGDG
jgi:hypothetical protein